MTQKATINLNIPDFKQHKARWMEVAKQNGWYAKPFFIQVWVDHDGNVTDSVAMRDMTSHLAFDDASDYPIGPFTLDPEDDHIEMI